MWWVWRTSFLFLVFSFYFLIVESVQIFDRGHFCVAHLIFAPKKVEPYDKTPRLSMLLLRTKV